MINEDEMALKVGDYISCTKYNQVYMIVKVHNKMNYDAIGLFNRSGAVELKFDDDDIPTNYLLTEFSEILYDLSPRKR
jgi:hypothetical protein